MRILVDTNVIIDYLRVSEKSTTLYEDIFKDSEKIAVISFVSIVELYAGKSIDKRDKEKVLEDLIEHAEILEANIDVYKKAGEIIRTYGTQFQDAIIAAQSLHYNISLLTLNRKDFKKIKGLLLYGPLT